MSKINKLSYWDFSETSYDHWDCKTLIHPTMNNLKVIIDKINEIIEKISPESENDDEENK